MDNPFKPDDRVQTKVKGTVVDAVVRLVWKDEVQVRTTDKSLLWRTAKSVWFPGAQPQPEPPKGTITGVQMTQAGTDSNDVHSSATPAEDGTISPAPTPVDAPDAVVLDSAPIANADLPQSGVVEAPKNITSCSGGDAPVAKRKMRRKKK